MPYAIGDSTESGTSGCDTSGSSFDSAEASSASVLHVVVGGYTKSKKMVHAALGGSTDGCFETPVAFVRYIDSTRAAATAVQSRYFLDAVIINPTTTPVYGRFTDVVSAKFAVRTTQNANKPTDFVLFVLKYETNTGDWSQGHMLQIRSTSNFEVVRSYTLSCLPPEKRNIILQSSPWISGTSSINNYWLHYLPLVYNPSSTTNNANPKFKVFSDYLLYDSSHTTSHKQRTAALDPTSLTKDAFGAFSIAVINQRLVIGGTVTNTADLRLITSSDRDSRTESFLPFIAITNLALSREYEYKLMQQSFSAGPYHSVDALSYNHYKDNMIGIGIARDKDYNPMGLQYRTLIYKIEIGRLPTKTGDLTQTSVIFADAPIPHEDPNAYANRADTIQPPCRFITVLGVQFLTTQLFGQIQGIGFWQDTTNQHMQFLFATNSDQTQLGNIGGSANNHLAYFEMFSTIDCSTGTISLKQKDATSVPAIVLPTSAAVLPVTVTTFYYFMYGRVCAQGCSVSEAIPRHTATDASMNGNFYYMATTSKLYQDIAGVDGSKTLVYPLNSAHDIVGNNGGKYTIIQLVHDDAVDNSNSANGNWAKLVWQSQTQFGLASTAHAVSPATGLYEKASTAKQLEWCNLPLSGTYAFVDQSPAPSSVHASDLSPWPGGGTYMIQLASPETSANRLTFTSPFTTSCTNSVAACGGGDYCTNCNRLIEYGLSLTKDTFSLEHGISRSQSRLQQISNQVDIVIDVSTSEVYRFALSGHINNQGLALAPAAGYVSDWQIMVNVGAAYSLPNCFPECLTSSQKLVQGRVYSSSGRCFATKQGADLTLTGHSGGTSPALLGNSAVEEIACPTKCTSEQVLSHNNPSIFISKDISELPHVLDLSSYINNLSGLKIYGEVFQSESLAYSGIYDVKPTGNAALLFASRYGAVGNPLPANTAAEVIKLMSALTHAIPRTTFYLEAFSHDCVSVKGELVRYDFTQPLKEYIFPHTYLPFDVQIYNCANQVLTLNADSIAAAEIKIQKNQGLITLFSDYEMDKLFKMSILFDHDALDNPCRISWYSLKMPTAPYVDILETDGRYVLLDMKNRVQSDKAIKLQTTLLGQGEQLQFMTSFAVKASIIDDFRFGYATVAVRVGCFEETKIKGTLTQSSFAPAGPISVPNSKVDDHLFVVTTTQQAGGVELVKLNGLIKWVTDIQECYANKVSICRTSDCSRPYIDTSIQLLQEEPVTQQLSPKNPVEMDSNGSTYPVLWIDRSSAFRKTVWLKGETANAAVVDIVKAQIVVCGAEQLLVQPDGIGTSQFVAANITMNSTSTSLALKVPYAMETQLVELSGLFSSTIPTCVIAAYSLKAADKSQTNIEGKISAVLKIEGDKLRISAEGVANYEIYIMSETIGQVYAWQKLSLEIFDASKPSFEPVLPVEQPLQFVTELPDSIEVNFENATHFKYFSPLLNQPNIVLSLQMANITSLKFIIIKHNNASFSFQANSLMMTDTDPGEYILNVQLTKGFSLFKKSINFKIGRARHGDQFNMTTTQSPASTGNMSSEVRIPSRAAMEFVREAGNDDEEEFMQRPERQILASRSSTVNAATSRYVQAWKQQLRSQLDQRNESAQMGTRKPVSMNVKGVSKTGLMTILFNQQLLVPRFGSQPASPNARLLADQEAVALQHLDILEQLFEVKLVVKSEYAIYKDLRLFLVVENWNSTQIDIRIHFAQPLAVSQGMERDEIELMVKDEARELFVAEDSLTMVDGNFILKQPLDRQLRAGLAQADVEDDITTALVTMIAITLIQVIGSLIIGGQGEKLWQLLLSVQLIAALPKYDSPYPAHVHMVIEQVSKIIHADFILSGSLRKLLRLKQSPNGFGLAVQTNSQNTALGDKVIPVELIAYSLGAIALMAAAFLLGLVAYLLASIVRNHAARQKLQTMGKNQYRSIFFNKIISLCTLSYLSFCVLLGLENKRLRNLDAEAAKGALLAIGALVMYLVGYIMISFLILWCYPEVLYKEAIKARIGNLYKDINLRRTKYVLWHYPGFLLQRLLFILITICWQDSPCLQVVYLLLLQTFYIIFLGLIEAPQLRSNFVLELMNESFKMVLFYHLMVFSAFNGDLERRFSMGTVFILVLCLFLFVNSCVISYGIIQPIRRRLQLKDLRAQRLLAKEARVANDILVQQSLDSVWQSWLEGLKDANTAKIQSEQDRNQRRHVVKKVSQKLGVNLEALRRHQRTRVPMRAQQMDTIQEQDAGPNEKIEDESSTESLSRRSSGRFSQSGESNDDGKTYGFSIQFSDLEPRKEVIEIGKKAAKPALAASESEDDVSRVSTIRSESDDSGAGKSKRKRSSTKTKSRTGRTKPPPSKPGAAQAPVALPPIPSAKPARKQPATAGTDSSAPAAPARITSRWLDHPPSKAHAHLYLKDFKDKQ